MSLYGGIDLTGRPNLENVMKLDLLPMGCLNEMSRVGFAIDQDYFRQLSSELDEEMRELRAEVCSYIPLEKMDEFISRSGLQEEIDEDLDPWGKEIKDWSPLNVDSNEQIAELLFDVLQLGKGRQLKLTKGGDRISTGKKQLELLKCNHEPSKPCTYCHPVVKPLLAYRERAKLKSTYTDALPARAKFHPRGNDCPHCGLDHWVDTWRVHTTFTTTRTTTGRIASKSPNLMNIPARTELGGRIRRGFVATPGCELVDADFSQFEMRLIAHYSLDSNLLRIFRMGLDPHTDTAMRAFGKAKEEVESKLGKLLYRAPCKNVNFGVAYGIGDVGLLDLMGMTYATAGLPLPPEWTKEKCGEFIRDWFRLYPTVEDFLTAQHYRARRYGAVWTLLGRVRRVPEVHSVHERVQGAGLRQAGNAPIQGTQADLMKIAMAEVYAFCREVRAAGIYCRSLVTVHDQLVLEVEKGYGEMVKENMTRIFGDVMLDRDTGSWMLAVPVEADGKVTERWEK